jgi:hypothetical protein
VPRRRGGHLRDELQRVSVIPHLTLLWILQVEPTLPDGCAILYANAIDSLRASQLTEDGKAFLIEQAAARRDECVRDRAAQERVPSEEQRRRDADAARAAAVARVLETPELMQAINSARLCVLTNERREALGVIAKERKYSKLGGVLHLQRIADAQDEVAAIDDQARQVRAALAETRRKPLSCRGNEVAGLAICLNARRNSGDATDPCQGEGIQIALRAVDESPY